MTDANGTAAPLAMSVQDSLWLTMDRPNALMVVDGAMVLAGEPTLAEVTEVFARAVARFPVFSRRAVRARSGWSWQPDPAFDLDRHVSAVRLSGSGDMRALQAFLAEQRAIPLPRDRPLWCGFLVEGVVLDDGRPGSAIVTRFHHAIADGVRLTQVMLSLCDGDHYSVAAVVAREPGHGQGGPAGLAKAAVEGVRGATVDIVNASAGVAGRAGSAIAAGPSLLGSALGEATATVGRVASDAVEVVKDPVAAAAGVPGLVSIAPSAAARAVRGAFSRGVSGVDDIYGLLRRPDRWLDALDVLGVEERRSTIDIATMAKLAVADSPATVWTGKPGRRKAIAWSSPMPLADIKRVGRHHTCTVNDVLLAAVAGGLRRYLAERDAEVEQVVWMVPVNLKPHSQNLPAELGNYFALVFLPMPLDDPDRRSRLRHLHRQMARIKTSDEAAMTFGLQTVVSQSPSQLAFALTNFFANKAVGVLTNVPGPRGPMTFAGVPVEQVVGFAPCSGNQPMTATIFSYDGTVTVGFATDAGLVPDPAALASAVADEVAAMVAELDAPPGRRASGGAGAPAKSTT